MVAEWTIGEVGWELPLTTVDAADLDADVAAAQLERRIEQLAGHAQLREQLDQLDRFRGTAPPHLEIEISNEGTR